MLAHKTKQFSKHHGQSGFTLIEILVVIGIILITTGLTAIFTIDNYRGYSFRSESNLVVTLLQKARGQSMNNVCLGSSCTAGQPHGLHITAPGQYVIFQGTYSSGSSSDPNNLSVNGNYPVTFSSGFCTDVIFAQLSGTVTTTPTGCSIIINADNRSSTITINSEGQITAN